MLTALIDYDIVCYRAGFVKEANEPSDHGLACALHNVKLLVNKIKYKLNPTKIAGFLTASGDTTNFRFEYQQDYKANRKEAPKPAHYHRIREYISKSYKAVTAVGEEADDLLSIYQYLHNNREFEKNKLVSVICSLDKDLDIVPGWHYNFAKNIVYFVEPIQGLRSFYKQILIGDRTDNVPRIQPYWKKADTFREIEIAQKESDLVEIVQKVCYTLFLDKNSNFVDDWIEARGRVLWPRTYSNELWALPGRRVSHHEHEPFDLGREGD